jgi:hypothetical protein
MEREMTEKRNNSVEAASVRFAHGNDGVEKRVLVAFDFYPEYYRMPQN